MVYRMANTIKGFFAAAAAFVLSLLGALAPWVAVILVAMVLDYITGMSAAWVAGELSSRIGIRGIVKKLGYLVIIAVGMIADWAIQTGGQYIGFQVKMQGFFALLIIIWLLVNELLSILENLGKLGVPYPEWFVKLLTHLKETAEREGEALDGD